MTDEQNRPEQNKSPDFGEIQIGTDQSASPGAQRPRPRSRTSAARPLRRKAAEPSPAARPAGETRRKKLAKPSKRSFPAPLLLLAVPVLLLLLHLAFSLYLFPMLAKGPLAARLSRQLGRPVSIGQASLSPFGLALHLSDIVAGPIKSRQDDQELAKIEDVSARIQLDGLLQGKIVLKDATIDRLRANLIRHADGSFNAIPPGRGIFSRLNPLPSWLRLRGLRLTRGTVRFLDQGSGRKDLMEHVEFHLPAAGQGLDPTLSAVVNSSPVQIIGQRHAEGSSSPETRLSLKLDDIDPQQYLALAPALAEIVTVRADSASAVLEIVLLDRLQSGKGPSVSGSLVFSSLVVQSAEHEGAPEQQQKKFELTAPKAQLIIRASPLQNLYAVEELILEEPRLVMADDGSGEALDGERLAVQAAALLDPKQLGIAVGRLSVSKGLVRSSRREWTDLQIELTGFRSSMAAAAAQEKAPAAALSLSAASGESSFAFKGSADSSFSLSGSLELKNMSADLLRPYLSARDDLRFAKGTTDLSGELRLDQLDGRAMLKVSGSSVAVRDFVLQQKKTVLLSGRTMNGSGCTLDGHDRRIVCSSLVLEQANFASPAFFLPGGGRKGRDGGGLRLSSGSLELKDASAVLPIGPSGLSLSGLRMNLAGLLLQQPGQLSLAATAGSQGTLEISGKVERGKDDALGLTGRIAAKNVDVQLLEPWLAASDEIRLAKGSADLAGELRLDLAGGGAALRIEGCSLAVRDFALQRNGTNLLVGKSLGGAACVLDGAGSGRRLACDRLTLEQADFADPAFFLQPSGRQGISCNALELKNASGSLPLGSGQGWPRLPLSGLRLSLTGLQGPQPGRQLSLAAAVGSQGALEVSGSVSGGKDDALGLTGQIAVRNMDADLLRPWLSPEGEIRFAGGVADLSGSLRLEQSSGAVVKIDGGSLAVRDFDLQRNGTSLLAGKAMRGADCALDGASRRMACARLSLDQANFAANAASFFLKPDGRLRFSANALEVADSSGLLPLGAGEDRIQLPLSGLKLSLTDLREQQPGKFDLNLEASVGSRGRIKADGVLGRDGHGSADMTASELDVRLFGRAVAGLFRDDSALALEQGSLSLDGRIDIPEGRFAGSFSVDQLAAESRRGDGLSWQRAAAENATVVLTPFSVVMDKLSLQDPAIRLASDGSLPVAFFAPFLQQEGNSVLMRLSAEECSISGGSLRRGGTPAFSDISGTVGPMKAGTPAAFALTGKMGEGDFEIEGRTSRTGASIDLLSVDRMPLEGVAKELAKELNADGTRARVARTVSRNEDRLDLSGFVPRPDSDVALALALLTGRDGSFGLPLRSVPLAASDDLIAQAVAEELRQLGRQPEKALPALADLPRSIEFMSGDKVPDFMDGIKGFPELLAARPHLGVAVRGCFDKEEDRKTILGQLQKTEEKKVEDENRRRQAELDRLMDVELKRQQVLRQTGRPLDQDHLPELRSRADLMPLPARPAELPDRALEDLAGQRAAVIRDHLVGRLGIPAGQTRVEDEGSCGSRVELALRPIW